MIDPDLKRRTLRNRQQDYFTMAPVGSDRMPSRNLSLQPYSLIPKQPTYKTLLESGSQIVATAGTGALNLASEVLGRVHLPASGSIKGETPAPAADTKKSVPIRQLPSQPVKAPGEIISEPPQPEQQAKPRPGHKLEEQSRPEPPMVAPEGRVDPIQAEEQEPEIRERSQQPPEPQPVRPNFYNSVTQVPHVNHPVVARQPKQTPSQSQPYRSPSQVSGQIHAPELPDPMPTLRTLGKAAKLSVKGIGYAGTVGLVVGVGGPTLAYKGAKRLAQQVNSNRASKVESENSAPGGLNRSSQPENLKKQRRSSPSQTEKGDEVMTAEPGTDLNLQNAVGQNSGISNQRKENATVRSTQEVIDKYQQSIGNVERGVDSQTLTPEQVASAQQADQDMQTEVTLAEADRHNPEVRRQLGQIRQDGQQRLTNAAQRFTRQWIQQPVISQ